MRRREGRVALAAPASDGPRVRVAAVILVGDKIVLVRQQKGGEQYYLLPGGGVKRGETLHDAILREVREETGLECRVQSPLLISDTIAPDGSRHLVNITFLATPVGHGTVSTRPLDEAIQGVDLVDPALLETLDLRPPIGAAVLAAIDSGFREPARYLGPLWTED